MKESSKENNLVLIGEKPLMNYVKVINNKFKQGGKELSIRARGKFITKAVDVAELVRKKQTTEERIEIKNIKIGTENFENKEGKRISVSKIEIILERK